MSWLARFRHWRERRALRRHAEWLKRHRVTVLGRPERDPRSSIDEFRRTQKLEGRR